MMEAATTPTTLAPDPAGSHEHLRRQLRALRRKHVSVAVLTGLALAVAVAVEMLAVVMFLDWWLDLPWSVRLLFLVGQAAFLGFILVRTVGRPLWRQPDEDALALMVEKARPEFHSRLIVAMQLSRPGAVPAGAASSLVDALLVQTQTLAGPQDFRSIVPTDRLKMIGFMALTVVLLGLAGLNYGRDVCGDLLRRAFLSNVPVPRKTRVVVLDGNKTIGQGDDVRLEAYAEGVIPAEGKLRVEYRHRRAQEYTLEQNPENPIHFGRTLESVLDSFDYVVYLNDGVSPEYTIQAIPRPTVARIECVQEFPAYTGLGRSQRPLGDLTLLAGSRLHLQITASKNIDQAALRLVGTDERVVPLQIQSNQLDTLTGSFVVPAQGVNGFSVMLLDTDAMESRDTAVYRLDVLPDKPPQVRLTHPDRKEELVTRQAVLLVGMDISDDFLISQVRLRYKVNAGEEDPSESIELDLGDEQPPHMQRAFPWNLDSIQTPLTEGSMIEFWIEAVDNNDATGPSTGSSEHQLARVVSRDEKLADALNRASDYLSGIEDVAEDQARANRNLGEIILEKAGPSNPR